MGNELDEEDSFIGFYLSCDWGISLGNSNRTTMVKRHCTCRGVYDFDPHHAVF